MGIRSAICLYGVVGGIKGKDGLGGNIPFKKCYDTYKKHIIDVNNADIFIHSWSVDVEDELVFLYKPKKYKFQEQTQFKHKQDDVVHGKNKAYYHKQGHRALSKWYSLKQSIELKKEYELEHNFKYDCVMLTRFDTLFFIDLDFSKLDLEYLWVPYFNTPDTGFNNDSIGKADRNNMSETGNKHALSDMWYFSNSKIIDEFTKIYDGVQSYKYRISQHKAAWDCFLDLGYKRKLIKYLLYRHYDFELYRWRLGNLYSKGDRDAIKK